MHSKENLQTRNGTKLFVSTEYDDLKLTETNIFKKHRKNEKFNESLNTKINDISETLLEHSQDTFDQEQYYRRDMV